MGIKVLPPDVNASAATFTPVGGDIRFGLAAVRNVGHRRGRRRSWRPRTAKGAFASFADFLRKVPVNVCNKRVIESLIKAGAFDSLGHPRKGLVLIHEQAIDTVIDVKRNEAIGQDSLFGGGRRDRGDVRGPGARRRVGQVHAARRSSGRCSACTCPIIRCSGSSTSCPPPPTARSRSCSAPPPKRPSEELTGERGDGQQVTVGGILSGVQRKVTRQGSPWAAATLEDLEGAIEVLFFPATYAECATLIADDAIVVVKGRLDRREDVAQAGRDGGERARSVGGRQRPFRGVDAGAAVRGPGGGAAPGGAA